MRSRNIGAGIVLMLVLSSSAWAQTPLQQASLRNGSYGAGAVVNTFPPNHGGSPGVPGVVSGPDGTLFIATEGGGRSHAPVHWPIGKNAAFRRLGPHTCLFHG